MKSFVTNLLLSILICLLICWMMNSNRSVAQTTCEFAISFNLLFFGLKRMKFRKLK